jgi:hypothetical protein
MFVFYKLLTRVLADFDLVSFLAYPNLFGTKGFVVVVNKGSCISDEYCKLCFFFLFYKSGVCMVLEGGYGIQRMKEPGSMIYSMN